MQKTIYQKAFDFRASHVEKCDDWEEFKAKIGTGKFLLCHWDGTAETEQKIKDETKATIRCIPVDSFVCEEEGKDIYSGKPSKQRVVLRDLLLIGNLIKLTMNVKAIKRTMPSRGSCARYVRCAGADGHDMEKRPVSRGRRRKASDTDRGDKGRGSETGLLEQVVDDEPELCPE